MRLNDENRMLPERVSAQRMPELSPGAPDVLLLPPGPDSPAGDIVSTGELMRVLRRRKTALIAAVLLGLGGGIAASVLTTPVYRARAMLQIDSPNESHFLREITPVSSAAPESYFNNQMKLLASDTLARRVADKLGIQAPGRDGISLLDWLANRETPSEDEQRIAIVKSAIRTRTSLQSQVVELTFEARDPERAARGANAVAAEFIDVNREARDNLVRNTTEWLTREAAALKTKLDESRRELEAYVRTSELTFAAGPLTLAEERTRQVQQALAAAETDRAARQARFEAAAGSPIEALPDIVTTGAIRDYQTERERLRREIADLTAVLTPTHYRVQRLNNQLAEVNDAIKRERAEILGRLRADYEAAASLEKRIADSYARQLVEAESQAAKAAAYNVRKHELDTTQALYDSMLTRVKEAGVASALRASNVRIIDSARPPSQPYRPNVPLNLAVGLAMGLTGGVAFVFMRERSGRVTRPGDAVLLEVPELGVIPSARDDRGLGARRLMPPKENGDLALVTWNHDTSLLSEAYRATLASILFGSASADPFSAGGAQGRALVVTSAEAMVGKTTVLTNLGIALAETGRRVLLVDADLRRPRLHEVFDICNDWGLTDLLQNPGDDHEASVESVARATRIPNLWVLPSGPGTAAIPRLLHSPNLHALMSRLRMLFDFVLADSAPIILYSDSRVLGRESDGVIVIARANRTSRDTLRATCARLQQDGIPVLGTVLNDWRIDRSEFPTYGDYYRRYHHPRKAG